MAHVGVLAAAAAKGRQTPGRRGLGLAMCLILLTAGCSDSGTEPVGGPTTPPDGWIYQLVDVDEADGSADLLEIRRVRTDGSMLSTILSGTIEAMDVTSDGSRLGARIVDPNGNIERFALADPDGSNAVFVTPAEDGSIRVFALAPNGRDVYYVGSAEGAPALKRIAEGDVAQLLTTLEGDTHHGLTISPSGNDIAVVAQTGGSSKLLRTDTQGVSLVVLEVGGDRIVSTPAWSIDGTALAFVVASGSGANAVDRVVVVGGDDRTEFTPTTLNGLIVERVEGISWTSEGQLVLSTRTSNGSIAHYRTNPDGSESQLISANSGSVAAPSPDGAWVVFGALDLLWIQKVGEGRRSLEVSTASGLVDLEWVPIN